MFSHCDFTKFHFLLPLILLDKFRLIWKSLDLRKFRLIWTFLDHFLLSIWILILPAQPLCGYRFCPGENNVPPGPVELIPGGEVGPPFWLFGFGGWKADEVTLPERPFPDPRPPPIMESDRWGEAVVEVALACEAAMAAAAAAAVPNMGL